MNRQAAKEHSKECSAAQMRLTNVSTSLKIAEKRPSDQTTPEQLKKLNDEYIAAAKAWDDARRLCPADPFPEVPR